MVSSEPCPRIPAAKSPAVGVAVAVGINGERLTHLLKGIKRPFAIFVKLHRVVKPRLIQHILIIIKHKRRNIGDCGAVYLIFKGEKRLGSRTAHIFRICIDIFFYRLGIALHGKKRILRNRAENNVDRAARSACRQYLCSPCIVISGYNLHLYAVKLFILGYGFDYCVVFIVGSLPRSYKSKIRRRFAVNGSVFKLFNGVF